MTPKAKPVRWWRTNAKEIFQPGIIEFGKLSLEPEPAIFALDDQSPKTEMTLQAKPLVAYRASFSQAHRCTTLTYTWRTAEN